MHSAPSHPPKVSPFLSLASLGFLICMSGFSSCGPANEPTTSAELGNSTDILATFYPLQSMGQRIMGVHGQVRSLLPQDADPQFHKPSRADLVQYQNARLILTNGGGFERWLGTASLPSSRVIDTAAGFDEPLIEHKGKTHSHGVGGEHSHTGTDAHYWLDPLLALEQARAIEASLSAAFPNQGPAFAENLTELEQELSALHNRLEQEIPSDARFLAGHPAYDYLARRYGWTIDSLDLDPGEPPTPEQWSEIAEAVERLKPHLMLWESEALPTTREALVERFGLHSVVFSPVENPERHGEGPELDFIGELARNITGLSEALKPR